MLMKMIADELLSDKTGDEIIDEINKAVDIPIISEKKCLENVTQD
jgi:hypothetical protein